MSILIAFATVSFESALVEAEDTFVCAPSQKFYLDLDAPNHRMSEWRQDDLGTLSALRATMKVTRLGDDPQWEPAFTLVLQSKGSDSAAHMLGLQLTQASSGSPLVFRTIRSDAGKVVWGKPLDKTIALNESIEIAMSWANPHAVFFRVGNTPVQKLEVSWRIESAQVTATTGDLELNPLEFGTLRSNTSR